MRSVSCPLQDSAFVCSGECELFSAEIGTKTGVAVLIRLCTLLHLLFSLWSFSQCFE